jgi:quercetin dioxygenase-like cupin family protein
MAVVRRIVLGLLTSFASPVSAQSLEDLIHSGTVPKTPSSPIYRKVLYSRIPDGANEVSVFLSRREAGTRTPIHKHTHVAISCLIEGEETFYIENGKPQRVVAPDCFRMPPGVRMMSVMTGKQDTLYYSIFAGAKEFSCWDVREKGVSSQMSDDFGRFDHQH